MGVGTTSSDSRPTGEPLVVRPVSALRAGVERIAAESARLVEEYDLCAAYDSRDMMIDLRDRAVELLARRYGV